MFEGDVVGAKGAGGGGREIGRTCTFCLLLQTHNTRLSLRVRHLPHLQRRVEPSTFTANEVNWCHLSCCHCSRCCCWGCAAVSCGGFAADNMYNMAPKSTEIWVCMWVRVRQSKFLLVDILKRKFMADLKWYLNKHMHKESLSYDEVEIWIGLKNLLFGNRLQVVCAWSSL